MNHTSQLEAFIYFSNSGSVSGSGSGSGSGFPDFPYARSPTYEVDSPTSKLCQFADAYMPITSGPNVQNTFSFTSAVDERTRNKLYGAWMTERRISCMALSSDLGTLI